MYQLESETTGDFERGMKNGVQNARWPVAKGQKQDRRLSATDAAKTILPL
jgi:hypothetical protein